MYRQSNVDDGLLICARYAFMPNKLRYCGGNQNSLLFDYTSGFYQDQGLKGLLQEFETLFPYIKLIAHENKISNPFDKRVVEAYWIGNNLLRNITAQNLYNHMVDTQELKKKLKPKLFEKVVGAIPRGALPHHNFHVINIPKRTGHYPVEHTIETMDKCRISWGQVRQIKDSKVQIVRRPLVINSNMVLLGKKKTNDCLWQIRDKGFVKNIKKGDWISLHWDFVCDKLSKIQVQNLKYYTQLSINLFNLEISK